MAAVSATSKTTTAATTAAAPTGAAASATASQAAKIQKHFAASNVVATLGESAYAVATSKTKLYVSQPNGEITQRLFGEKVGKPFVKVHPVVTSAGFARYDVSGMQQPLATAFSLHAFGDFVVGGVDNPPSVQLWKQSNGNRVEVIPCQSTARSVVGRENLVLMGCTSDYLGDNFVAWDIVKHTPIISRAKGIPINVVAFGNDPHTLFYSPQGVVEMLDARKATDPATRIGLRHGAVNLGLHAEGFNLYVGSFVMGKCPNETCEHTSIEHSTAYVELFDLRKTKAAVKCVEPKGDLAIMSLKEIDNVIYTGSYTSLRAWDKQLNLLGKQTSHTKISSLDGNGDWLFGIQLNLDANANARKLVTLSHPKDTSTDAKHG